MYIGTYTPINELYEKSDGYAYNSTHAQRQASSTWWAKKVAPFGI